MRPLLSALNGAEVPAADNRRACLLAFTAICSSDELKTTIQIK
jgi:hypothetical protein